MPKRKMLGSQFTLDQCKTQINIFETKAFLNLQLPDGRWIVFETTENRRIPQYEDELQTHVTEQMSPETAKVEPSSRAVPKSGNGNDGAVFRRRDNLSVQKKQENQNEMP